MKDEPAYAQPKPRPRALERQAKRSALETLDKRESAKAKKRAHGLCEVLIRQPEPKTAAAHIDVYCNRRDTETHHLISGTGRRGRGDSALAIWKLRVCASCHRLITARLLVPVDARANAKTVVYRMVR